MPVANSNFIRGQLCEDSYGRIWYTNETGVYFYNPVKEQIEKAHDFTRESKDGFVYYSAVMLDEAENLWILNPGVGMLRFSISKHQSELIPFPGDIKEKEYPFIASLVGKYIYLHFNTRSGNLRYDPATRNFDWVFTDYPNIVIRGDLGGLFLMQNNQLYRYDSATQQVRKLSCNINSTYREAIADSFGRIWLTSNGDGLIVCFADEEQSITYRHSMTSLNSLPFDITTTLFIDATNNLWIVRMGEALHDLILIPFVSISSHRIKEIMRY